jgi:hypothetical protein
MKNLEEYRSQCDACGKLKYGCRDIWISYMGDTHACPECLGDEAGAYGEYEHEDKLERDADWRFHADWD